MSKFESVFLSLFLGVLIILITFFFGWWTGYGAYKVFTLSESIIIAGMILGIMLGIILNIVFLRKWINNPYNLSNYIWIIAYFILTVGTIGFFMGVPVFNIIPGFMAGIFIGRKSKHTLASEEAFKKSLKTVNILNAITLLMICIFSAALALSDPYTEANLQGMFNIKTFEITKAHIVGIILLGGIGLISVQYLLTQKFAYVAYRKNC